MDQFLKKLRQSVNHVSDEGHAALHKEIRQVALRHFSGTKNEDIEEWLHTEEMHASDFPRSEKILKEMKEFGMSNEDLRADTDRVMFGTLEFIRKFPKYRKKLEAFRKNMIPVLEELDLTPTFNMMDLDKMPWDAAHVFHVVMAHNFSGMGDPLAKEGILRAEDVADYRKAVKSLDHSYWTFGGEFFAEDLKKSNDALWRIWNYLMVSSSRPSFKMIVTESGASCTKEELSSAVMDVITELLSSI